MWAASLLIPGSFYVNLNSSRRHSSVLCSGGIVCLTGNFYQRDSDLLNREAKAATRMNNLTCLKKYIVVLDPVIREYSNSQND